MSVSRSAQVNAHTHLYSGLAPLGMPPPARTPASFVEILELVWWKLDRALDEATLRASARLYLAEALLAGTTTLFDHHESPAFIDGSLDVLAEEAELLGARLFVTYGATERNGGRDEAKRGLAECARFVRANRFPHVKGLVGLHASFTVSDETLREAGALAQELSVPLHVHVAEAQSDMEDARRRGYESPLERLIDTRCLPPRSILAHGVWLDKGSVERADAMGAWLVQNPRSNANNNVGYPKALGASGHVALGTDGFPANMDDEASALEEAMSQRGGPASRAKPPLMGRVNGSLAMAELFDPSVTEDVVEGEPGKPPTSVVVAGRKVVENGRLVTADIRDIRGFAAEQAKRLWSRMGAIK